MMSVGAKPEKLPSSDCSLLLENMKLESPVIVDQHATVNLYPSLGHLARHIAEIGFARKIIQLVKNFKTIVEFLLKGFFDLFQSISQ